MLVVAVNKFASASASVASAAGAKVPIRLESHTLGAADRTVKVDKRQERRVPIRIDFLQLASLKVDKRRKRRLEYR